MSIDEIVDELTNHSDGSIGNLTRCKYKESGQVAWLCMHCIERLHGQVDMSVDSQATVVMIPKCPSYKH